MSPDARRTRRRLLLGLLALGLGAPRPARSQGDLGGWLQRGLEGLGRGRTAAEGGGLAPAEVGAGLREALVVGIRRVVDTLGRPGGFLESRRFRIPLPSPLAEAGDVLRMAGLGALVDDLEVRMNRGAEQAVRIAADLFITAIRELTFRDALAILEGPPDAATRYLERTTGAELERRMRPIVEAELRDAGALALWQRLVGEVGTLPFVGRPERDLTDHVLAATRKALFTLLAEEERRIRTEPAARTTELLRRVFGR